MTISKVYKGLTSRFVLGCRMSVELRKVLKLGQATLAITLPRHWVKMVKLKEGDHLRIRVFEGDKLLLEKAGSGEEAPIVCSFTLGEHFKEPKLLSRMVIGAYINGADIIFIPINSEISDHVLREVEKTSEILFGVCITESTEDTLILQVIVDPRKPTINTSIMRIHLLIFNMVRTALRALVEGNIEYILKGLDEVCEDCGRVYWLAVRQLLKAQSDYSILKDLKLKSQLWIVGNRAVLSILRHALHLAEEIKDTIRTVKIRSSDVEDSYLKSLIAVSEELYEVAENVVRSLLACDALRANRSIETLKSIEGEIVELEEKITSTNVKTQSVLGMGKILWCLRELGYCYKMIGEIAINRSVERTGKYSSVDLGRPFEEFEEYF